MKDVDLCPSARIAGFKQLDSAGPYKAALERGINGAIQLLMKEEKDDAVGLFTGDDGRMYSQWVMSTLFRGGRQEGRQASSGGGFSHIDGYRCKKYVLSSPDAFEDWFEASMKSATVFVQRDLSGDDQLRIFAQRAARDVASAWGFVFVNRKVSKAIVLGQSGKPDEAAQRRAKWALVQQLKPALVKVWNAPESFDTGGTIEANLYQIASMLFCRLNEFGVKIAGPATATKMTKDDITKLLGMKGTHKKMFNNFSLPIAEATLEKGRTLSNDETKAILATTMNR